MCVLPSFAQIGGNSRSNTDGLSQEGGFEERTVKPNVREMPSIVAYC
jgi:hypothetical protein